ncbi:anti-sigma factor antagonist [Acrocarpospora corrugata]|uniref:Anti-sigma factor antagonist n=1 Tax=Acrocarpospora corrugata TaxID=35763 RepID=A0A5M3W4E8_9ACTN|nr:STAS domain-containing protein [Acrocarpospora corrugata]GES03654.1 anti-sigma factor antagonist [Acrocarpospora corrugata]
MPADFQVTTERYGPLTVITVTGELDALTGAHLLSITQTVLTDPGARLLLDLTSLTFLDSSGLKVIISVHQILGWDGERIALCGLIPRVARLFQLLDLDSRMRIHSSRATALASIPPGE